MGECTDLQRGSGAAILNATKQLHPIRNLVSPVFLSTRPPPRGGADRAAVTA